MRSISLPHNHGSAIERHIDSIPKTEDFQNLSDVFRLLGDSSRLRIFWILCHCEECVINISAMMEMSSPAVSHHLKMLKASKLIVSRRDGKEVYYQATHGAGRAFASNDRNTACYHLSWLLSDLNISLLNHSENT